MASEVVPGLSSILFLLEEGFKAKKKKKKRAPGDVDVNRVGRGYPRPMGAWCRQAEFSVLSPSLFSLPQRAPLASQDFQAPTARRAHG